MAVKNKSEDPWLEQRFELRNRYLFTGTLVLLTAMHIGGGSVTLSGSDSPVVLTPDQQPFIPGSSFKGSLRSTVEKIVPSLPAAASLRSCALIERSTAEIEQEFPDVWTKRNWPAGVCPTSWQSGLVKLRREAANPQREEALTKQAQQNLCQTCRLFSSPLAAARLNVDDLYHREWSGAIQMRDGVAIDRDSEKAKDRLKYDFEVVPASATFNLRLVLENATPQDLQLVCVGLSEFVHGYGTIGGKRSRGLGVTRLDDLKVQALELEDPATRSQRLRDYLVRNQFSREIEGPDFLAEHIDSLFE